MTKQIILAYLFIISAISATFFIYDKYAAKKGKTRISEKHLHFCEMAGGVFINMLLMYFIRHKNRKFSYYSITWVTLIAWITIIYFAIKHQII